MQNVTGSQGGTGGWELIEGWNPEKEGLKAAEEVGILYEREEYFLADLLMTGDALKVAMDVLKPKLSQQTDIKPQGSILIGTVEGDIHDLGKSLVVSLLNGQGFSVIDLGSDVPPEIFVEKAKEINPDVIGLSGLLTSSVSISLSAILTSFAYAEIVKVPCSLYILLIVVSTPESNGPYDWKSCPGPQHPQLTM